MAEDKYEPSDDNPHVDQGTCGKCRQPIEKGHRIQMAHIVDRVGKDPMNLARSGLFLFEEYEFVHTCCADPFLKKG